MTPDQRFWRLLTLIEEFYAGGERTSGDPPPVRFPRPVAEPEPEPSVDAGREDSLDAVAREVAACRCAKDAPARCRERERRGRWCW